MSKYDPLKAFLMRGVGPELTLSFAQIEQILGEPLPTSAREQS